MQGRKHNFFSDILFSLSVPKCLSCKEPLLKNEKALCGRCFVKYTKIKNRSCSRCMKKLEECSCTNFYMSMHYVRGLAKVYRYRYSEEFEAANSVLFRLKHINRNDALDFVAEEVFKAITISIPHLDENTVVTHIPNRKKAIKKYGFDHAELLARSIAEKLGAEFVPLLISLSKKPQKETSGEERFLNANFKLIYENELVNKNVLIVDDIVTTGASMGNAAALIRGLRPKGIYGACFGIAYWED